MQEKVDNPIQLFFNPEPLHISHFNLSSPPSAPPPLPYHSSVLTVPLSKGKLKLTLVNLSNQTENLNKSALIDNLWYGTNAEPFDSYVLSEVSLSGNMPIAEVQERKIKWKTKDDHPKVKESKEEEEFIKMEHMKIRVYEVAYNYTEEHEELED